MTANPFDQNAIMRELKAIRDMLRANPLRHASVDRGRLRMKNGSQLIIEGLLQVIGSLTGSGDLEWTGPWELAGDGDITGDVDVTGDIEVLGAGQIRVGGVLITPVGGGRIQIGSGASQIVLDGATGKIRAGNLTIDPTTGGGAVVFSNGTQVFSGANGQIEMFSGSKSVHIDNNEVRISTGSRAVGLRDTGIYMVGLPTIPRASANNAVVGTVWADTNGNLYRVI